MVEERVAMLAIGAGAGGAVGSVVGYMFGKWVPVPSDIEMVARRFSGLQIWNGVRQDLTMKAVQAYHTPYTMPPHPSAATFVLDTPTGDTEAVLSISRYEKEFGVDLARLGWAEVRIFLDGKELIVFPRVEAAGWNAHGYYSFGIAR